MGTDDPVHSDGSENGSPRSGGGENHPYLDDGEADHYRTDGGSDHYRTDGGENHPSLDDGEADPCRTDGGEDEPVLSGGDPDVPGFDAFVHGVQITVAVTLLVAFTKYGEGFAQGYAALSRVGGQDAATTITGIALVVLVVSVLLLAVPMYAALHTADVAITTPAGAVPVDPGLFGLPDLVYLVPPVVLVWAGYRQGRTAEVPSAEARALAGASVAFSYLFVALIAVVPSTWLFDAVVNDVVLSEAPAAAGSVQVAIRSPLRAHLLVGVVYPVVFGALGGVIAHSVAGTDAAPRQSALEWGREGRTGGGQSPGDRRQERGGDEATYQDREPQAAGSTPHHEEGDRRRSGGDQRRTAADDRERTEWGPDSAGTEGAREDRDWGPGGSDADRDRPRE